MIQTEETYSIRLLGTVEVERGGKRVETQLPQKGLALLAYLASAGGAAQPRHKLADFLWPDLCEEAARNNLRQTLLGMKRCLEGEGADSSCLVADRQSIRLDTTVSCFSDLSIFLSPLPDCSSPANPENCAFCFEQMEARTRLYRGQFLENLNFEGSLAFEDWLLSQRETLLQRALFLLERLVGCTERQGRYDKALLFAQRFIELSPWSDEGMRRVIRLASLNGQRGFALSQYQTFCRTLKNELGVAPEPATRALARRIQQGEFAPVALEPDPAPDHQELPAQNVEKRQLTICYCQLVPEREQDPDDEYELLEGALIRCREILSIGMGYTVRNERGCGLFAYFGYPQSRENAAALAVRASLTLVTESFSGVGLRIGVYTGIVLSARDKLQPDINGRATDRALGLSSLAGDQEVVVSVATRRLLAGNNFRFRDLGERLLPCGGAALTCFKVEKLKLAPLAAELAEDLKPLVGRERELASLKKLWRSVLRGKGQALLLQGEPGIGKSRLVRALKDSLTDDSCAVLEFQCGWEFSQSPFKPVINFLHKLLDLASLESSGCRMARLQKSLERWCPEMAEVLLPLAADLLAVAPEASRQQNSLSSRGLRERTMDAALEVMTMFAEEKPVLLIVEDLHWIDPTTLEALTKLVRDAVPGSVFMLVTARSQFEPPWTEAEVPRLCVSPLSDKEIRRMITAQSPEMSASLLDTVAERADGVPLFAEELSRLPVDCLSSDQFIVPSSLQDLLAARLDGLGQDKRFAQLAATIGRDFSPALLAELSLLDKSEVVDALFRLKNLGLVSPSSADRWQFRHALIRDAAYLSQPRTDRESAHLRIAQIFETVFADIVRDQPELLAYHWSQAGENEPAINNWIQAGLLAQARSAHHEAVGHFKSGLSLLPRLKCPATQHRMEWQLQVGLGASAYTVEGYASPQGAAAYNRAVELGEQEGDFKQGFAALWGLWAGTSSHLSWAHSLQLAKRLVRIVKNGKDPVARQQGYFALGNVQFWRGEFASSRRSLEQAIGMYSPPHHHSLVSGYGENCYATSSSYLSWNLCRLGFLQQALNAGQRAVSEARRVDHPFSLGYALTFFTVLHRMLRQPAATLELSEQTIALATEHDFPLWRVGATLKRGWAQVMLGNHHGLAEMQWSVDQVAALMSGISVIFLETQADALLCAGKPHDALRVIDRGLEMGGRLDDHHVEADLYRLKGTCLLEISARNMENAEICFSQALRISRQQKALLLELRAAMALARLRSRQNRDQEGRRLLTDVYNRFTEGFSLPDLCEANQLLKGLLR